MNSTFRFHPGHLMLGMALAAGLLISGVALEASEIPTGNTTYLRGAYQYGWVLETSDFITGDNLKGQPIDIFKSARLEFGWQTDGSKDWHHLYNFPSYGIGLYGADYFNDTELGKPTSLYGFFSWPVSRWSDSWQWNFDLSFGLTDNWVAHDPETNPKNVVIGAGRSVHIDLGTNVEYRMGRHWSLLGGFSLTHFSNGGSAQPNSGLNQVAPLLFVKYKFKDRKLPDRRTEFPPFEPEWNLGITGSVGLRSIAHNTADLPNPERTVYQDYFIGTILLSANRQVSQVTCWSGGLDITYDESVEDLLRLEGLRQGVEQSVSFIDSWSLGVYGGYERVVNRAHILIHLGYTIMRRDVDAQVPRLFQRVGLRYYIWDNFAAGLNVRLNDFSRANNLEFNVGYWFGS